MELIELMPLVMLTIASFWLKHPALFIATGAVSMFTGFYYYDNYVTFTGLALSMCLIVLGLVFWGWTFKLIFWNKK